MSQLIWKIGTFGKGEEYNLTDWHRYICKNSEGWVLYNDPKSHSWESLPRDPADIVGVFPTLEAAKVVYIMLGPIVR